MDRSRPRPCTVRQRCESRGSWGTGAKPNSLSLCTSALQNWSDAASCPIVFCWWASHGEDLFEMVKPSSLLPSAGGSQVLRTPGEITGDEWDGGTLLEDKAGHLAERVSLCLNVPFRRRYEVSWMASSRPVLDLFGLSFPCPSLSGHEGAVEP